MLKFDERGLIPAIVQSEDAILVLAEPAGPTCHTGRVTCFWRDTSGNALAEEEAS